MLNELDSKIAALEIVATGKSGAIGTLDIGLPAVRSGVVCTADVDFPAVKIEGSITTGFTVTFNVADDDSTALGSDSLLDLLTTAELETGESSGVDISDGKITIGDAPVDQWSSDTDTTLTSADYDDKRGYRFTVEKAITVTHLSIFGHQNAPETLELWRDSDESLLCTATGNATTGAWTFLPVDAEVVLSPGELYVVAKLGDGTRWYDYENPSSQLVDTDVVRFDDSYYRYTSDPSGYPDSYSSLDPPKIGFRFEHFTGEGSWVSPAIDVGSYADGRRGFTLLLDSTIPSYTGTNLTVYAGVSDSDSVDPTEWIEQGGHGYVITGLPQDLTGKYLYIKFLFEATDKLFSPEVSWLVVYDYYDEPEAIVRITFNGESQEVPLTGTIDFDNVSADQTLSYSVSTLRAGLTGFDFTTPVTGDVTIDHAHVTENVEVSRIFSVTGETAEFSLVAGDAMFGARTYNADIAPVMCEASMIRTSFSMEADLPTIGLEASFGERMSADISLPTFDIESGRFGSRGSASLECLTLEGEILSETICRLDKRLPTLSIESRAGSRADSITLPALTLTVEISTPVLCRLNKKLPGIKGEATSTGASASLSKPIGFPDITATGSTNITGDVDSKIPFLKIVSTGKSGAIGTADIDLPAVKIDAESHSVVINLDAYLPTITTGVASGKDYGGFSNVVSGDRFEDDILRHERWA